MASDNFQLALSNQNSTFAVISGRIPVKQTLRHTGSLLDVSLGPTPVEERQRWDGAKVNPDTDTAKSSASPSGASGARVALQSRLLLVEGPGLWCPPRATTMVTNSRGTEGLLARGLSAPKLMGHPSNAQSLDVGCLWRWHDLGKGRVSAVEASSPRGPG